MAVLSVLSVTTSFVSCPPLLLPLKFNVFAGDLFRPAKLWQILPQNWHNTFSFACGDIIWVRDRFCTFTQMAFEISKRKAQFSTYVTVRVGTLWNRCWTLFVFANQTFVSTVLHTAIRKGFYGFLNQFPPLTSIWSHFFPIGPQVVQIVSGNILLRP